jgi:hypothetical protein
MSETNPRLDIEIAQITFAYNIGLAMVATGFGLFIFASTLQFNAQNSYSNSLTSLAALPHNTINFTTANVIITIITDEYNTTLTTAQSLEWVDGALIFFGLLTAGICNWLLGKLRP